MPRKLKKAKITFVSLVPRGANKIPVIKKSEDGNNFEITAITKSDDFVTNGEIQAIIYAPGMVDAHNDTADKEFCKDACYGYAREGHQIDIRHDFKPLTKDQAFVAENYLTEPTDSRFKGTTTSDGEVVNLDGAWAQVIKILDPDLRKEIHEKEWDGVSMGGVLIDSEDIPDEEFNMKPDEFIKALLENKDEIRKIFVKEETSPKTPPNEDDTEKFVGDPTNLDDVKKHREKLEKKALLKDVDFSDPESVKKYEATLKERESNSQTAPETGDPITSGITFGGVSRETSKTIAKGMAEFVNGRAK